MKTEVFPMGEFFDLPNSQLHDEAKLGTVDWKERPIDVLEEVDKLLSRHGLEIVIFTCTGDDYDFAVLPRSP